MWVVEIDLFNNAGRKSLVLSVSVELEFVFCGGSKLIKFHRGGSNLT